jgi:hypothetical protein
VILDLSTGDGGGRVVTVLLDASGRLLSASDHVHFREAGAAGAPVRVRQESIGGRFEADGTFRGTCWLLTGPEPPDDEPPQWEMTPRPPRPDEVERLRGLTAELLRRPSA